jgi:hypothetical protein
VHLKNQTELFLFVINLKQAVPTDPIRLKEEKAVTSHIVSLICRAGLEILIIRVLCVG